MKLLIIFFFLFSLSGFSSESPKKTQLSSMTSRKEQVLKATSQELVSQENAHYKPWTCDLSKLDSSLFFQRIIVQTRPRFTLTVVQSEDNSDAANQTRDRIVSDLTEILPMNGFIRATLEKEDHRELEHCGSNEPYIKHFHLQSILYRVKDDRMTQILLTLGLSEEVSQDLLQSYKEHSRINFCDACGSPFRPLRCSQCQFRKYCNRKCQKSRWSKHSKECKAIAAEIAKEKEKNKKRKREAK